MGFPRRKSFSVCARPRNATHDRSRWWHCGSHWQPSGNKPLYHRCPEVFSWLAGNHVLPGGSSHGTGEVVQKSSASWNEDSQPNRTEPASGARQEAGRAANEPSKEKVFLRAVCRPPEAFPFVGNRRAYDRGNAPLDGSALVSVPFEINASAYRMHRSRPASLPRSETARSIRPEHQESRGKLPSACRSGARGGLGLARGSREDRSKKTVQRESTSAGRTVACQGCHWPSLRPLAKVLEPPSPLGAGWMFG
jgi:hypothetical protein